MYDRRTKYHFNLILTIGDYWGCDNIVYECDALFVQGNGQENIKNVFGNAYRRQSQGCWFQEEA
ncbi:unnamed protein product (macronuclear) [Paramecium tetraurelia]|uniref:Uncharacterized protein n=1 Tax=Paramecium tetraurelia TaxID=5888 RepID=A0C4N8_PARTE|nr:uncharacterized protein GSPATT00006254001 [Paramecium tetraurelia]CAK65755.1 unnamed protein product [Paramecium tetraurelia]|eukprot:XP_001433152.1 hypothetical protein (macronuclear) [Paramecium tetraurelia strain d4-2]